MNFSKLDAFMQSMPARGVPSSALSVTVDGKTVYRADVGYSDVAKTKPAGASDLYWLYSASKVITCIAVMRLVEEGRLSLTDPVKKYLPEFSDMTVKDPDGTIRPAKSDMTVEQLFTMTAGLDYGTRKPSIQEAIQKGGNTRQIISAMAENPLNFDPGTRYCYSFCHDVLAAVAEVVTGMRYADYMNELLFRPLGIVDMGFHPSPEQESRIADMYHYRRGAAIPVPITTRNEYCFTPNFDSGGAGLFGSVDEYMKIITPIACGGTSENGYQILKPETIRLFTENHLSDVQRDDFVTTRRFGYGFGLCGRVHVDPTVSLCLSPVGEFGWSSASGHHVLIDIENRVAFHFATHLLDCDYAHNMIHPALRNLVYEGLAQ